MDVACLENAHELALVDHGDAVREDQNLAELGRHQKNGRSGISLFDEASQQQSG